MLQELLFPGQVFSVQVSDSQNPEEAGLQHSRSTFSFSPHSGSCGHTLLVMRYMLLMLFQVFHVMRTCTAMIPRCL